MALGLRTDRRRRRRQFRAALLRWLVVIVLIAGAGAYAYQQGSALAQRGVGLRDEQIRSLNEQLQTLQTQAEAHDAAIAAERARAEEWQQRYQRDAGTGEMRDLLQLLQARRDQGVTAERLREVIARTERRQECDANPQARRVLVQTPISGGAQSPVGFAGGNVRIALSGVSARSSSGDPEAWFDPKLPVSVRIIRGDGSATESSGLLPLQAALVDGDQEYRFTIAAAARGFAQVTLQRCRFP